jgi:hypothetical protein
MGTFKRYFIKEQHILFGLLAVHTGSTLRKQLNPKPPHGSHNYNKMGTSHMTK